MLFKSGFNVFKRSLWLLRLRTIEFKGEAVASKEAIAIV
jgi:hypothetical protein